MDGTDYRILEILGSDGRISMKNLAAHISMSISSTIERVRKLEDAGVIEGYRAVINPEKLGREVTAYILVCIPVEVRPEFYQLVEETEDIVESYEITGRFQALVKVSCGTMQQLLALVNRLYAWGASETYVITKKLKSRG
jgi:Lrp/AsnC family transcriptional regulator, leucine-responsive regulatory protein